MNLHPIELNAQPEPDFSAREISVLEACLKLYARNGFTPPWIAYFATEGDTRVGTCGFKSPPQAGVVEIAYHTFPGNEGKGLASEMCRLITELAFSEPDITAVEARTLPQPGPSTQVLTKNGFSHKSALIDPEDGPVWLWELRRVNHDANP